MNKEKLREYVVSKFSSYIKDDGDEPNSFNSIDGIVAQIEESYKQNRAKIGLAFIMNKIDDGYRIEKISFDISHLLD